MYYQLCESMSGSRRFVETVDIHQCFRKHFLEEKYKLWVLDGPGDLKLRI